MNMADPAVIANMNDEQRLLVEIVTRAGEINEEDVLEIATQLDLTYGGPINALQALRDGYVGLSMARGIH